MSAIEKAVADHLFEVLATFDGLDTFRLLPETDQQKFLSWIARSRDEASYWARIDVLALAMRAGPLRSEIRFEPPRVADGQR